MPGLLIGLVCGAGELFLLTRLTKVLLAGDMFKTFIYVLFKFLLIAAVLASVTIWFRSDLIWCGVGISSVLIIGAIIINIRNRRNGKGEK
ncbi:MAG: hypothetical protein CVV04_08405 [Firmicutes bacterium HGW-Firmicutes-9]|jgi:hypothetical protein|nr:MAG: hypothetical protein CVV04_08405 [Firmicutes bacterium HGW-Firmicutes-9]